MTTVVSNEFKTLSATLFMNQVVDEDIFLFVSSVLDDENTNNSKQSKLNFLEKTLFGKKIDSSSAFYMIKNNIWQSGTEYVQYDDTKDMTNQNFYAVVYPGDSNTGEYLIFKCLFNNNRAKSVVAPYYDDNVPEQIYTVADGYVWKFLYALSTVDFDKYNVYGYIPIDPDRIASANNSTERVDQIFVENPVENYGYRLYYGNIVQTFLNTNEIMISGITPLSQVENYYRDQTFYVTKDGVESKAYRIIGYRFDIPTNRGFVQLEITADKTFNFITNNSTFQIMPRILIEGDGVNAEAIPVVQDNKIQSILMLDRGEGYTNARARVIDPLYDFDVINTNSSDVRAIVRPIISNYTRGLLQELQVRAVMLYSRISESENLEQLIPTSSNYTKLGVVKNPEFKSANTPLTFDNRISIDIVDNTLVAGESVIQFDEISGINTFESIVHESTANTVYLASYMGPFVNTANSDVSFDPTMPLRDVNNQSYNVVINIDDEYVYQLSDYIQRTGEVLYMTSFSPIGRNSSSNEQYKIILEF